MNLQTEKNLLIKYVEKLSEPKFLKVFPDNDWIKNINIFKNENNEKLILSSLFNG